MGVYLCAPTNGEPLNDVNVRNKPMQIRLVWIFFVAAIIQVIPFIVLAPELLVALKKALLISSYLFLCWGLINNLHYWSTRVILFGVLLNFVGIAANDCLMPVSPEAISISGMPELGTEWLGKVTPHGTGILLTMDQTNLWIFTDIFPVKLINAVLSLGDLVLVAGLLLFTAELLIRKTRNILDRF